jgi:hypothetical protein
MAESVIAEVGMTEKPKRLYVVTVESSVVVVAEDVDQARVLARKPDVEFNFEALGAHISELTYLPDDWDEDSIPFGLRADADRDRTIGGWIDAGAAPVYRELRKTRRST